MNAIRGVVERGAQLGRRFGFPTANLKVSADDDLPDGVYASWLIRADGTVYPGAASLGVRPTVATNGERLLEVHIFDSEQWIDLYDETVTVRLVQMIRPEEKFDTTDALIDQIRRDCDSIRRILRTSVVPTHAPAKGAMNGPTSP